MRTRCDRFDQLEQVTAPSPGPGAAAVPADRGVGRANRRAKGGKGLEETLERERLPPLVLRDGLRALRWTSIQTRGHLIGITA